jgi:hypothetical protein
VLTENLCIDGLPRRSDKQVIGFQEDFLGVHVDPQPRSQGAGDAVYKSWEEIVT